MDLDRSVSKLAEAGNNKDGLLLAENAIGFQKVQPSSLRCFADRGLGTP